MEDRQMEDWEIHKISLDRREARIMLLHEHILQLQKNEEIAKFAKENEDLDRKVTKLQEQVENMGRVTAEKTAEMARIEAGKNVAETAVEESQTKLNAMMGQMTEIQEESLQKINDLEIKHEGQKLRLRKKIKNRDTELTQLKKERLQMKEEVKTVQNTRKIEELQTQIMRTRERLIEKASELKAARDLQNEIDTMQGR